MRSSPAGAATRRRRRLLTRRDKLVLALMVGIPTLIHVALVWVPALGSIALSFARWDGIGGLDTIQWIGTLNYRQIFTIYPPFWPAVQHNIIWLVFFIVVPTAFGLFLAVQLDKQLRGSRIYQSILFQRSKRSPWLGFSVLLLTPEKRKELGDPRLYGILIDNVFDPSPATAGGVQVGDVLQTMNRQRILTVYDFQRWTYSFGIGAPVELGIVRKGQPMVLKTVIAERPPDATTR